MDDRRHCRFRNVASIAGLALVTGACSDATLSSGNPESCLPAETEVQVEETAGGIRYVRTPEERFENLDGYPFEPNYVTIDGLEMHYLDEGPPDGEIVLLLHDEPAWSYAYRGLVGPLAAQGYRVVAPDLIGMGRSDKPIDLAAHTYEGHVDWLARFVEALDLRGITLVGHGWGGTIGLRLAADQPERFGRLAISNADLLVYEPGRNPFVVPAAAATDCTLGSFSEGTVQEYIDYAMRAPDLRPSEVVEARTQTDLSPESAAAHDAPYPSFIYKAAIRAFPALIATIELQNEAAWERLGASNQHFVTHFSEIDPVRGSVEIQNRLIAHLPGSAGQLHQRFAAAHFIQEDMPLALLPNLAFFARANRIDGPGLGTCWKPEEPESVLDCDRICARLGECNPDDASVRSGVCPRSCEVSFGQYLSRGASEALESCMLAKSCDEVEGFQGWLDACLIESLGNGSIVPDPAKAAPCGGVGQAVTACDPDATFAGVCTGISFAFTAEAVQQVGACADARCEDMADCIRDAVCVFLFDNAGALPQVP